MGDDTQTQPLSKRRVLYAIPEMDRVAVRRVPYTKTADGGGTLMMDVYTPFDSDSQPAPVMILVTGYSDVGARKHLGCAFAEMGAFVSWAQLIAASGLIAVTYENEDPRDVHSAIQYVHDHAAALGADPQRIGVWSTSGHAPNALSLLLESSGVGLRCAVLCYPYTVDLDGATLVAEASTQWGFANACAGRTVSELSRDVPMFVARAGEDAMPGLNKTLDRFITEALACNLPITVVNHARAPHAFDLFHDSVETRGIVAESLRFAQLHLGAVAVPRRRPDGLGDGRGPI